VPYLKTKHVPWKWEGEPLDLEFLAGAPVRDAGKLENYYPQPAPHYFAHLYIRREVANKTLVSAFGRWLKDHRPFPARMKRGKSPAREFMADLRALGAWKGEARVRDSFQPESDAHALREYRQELRRLQMETAQAAGEPEEVARLEGEMEALESALKGASAADTGERAFDNVRKVLRVVLEPLRRGGPEEQAFAEHLRTHLSIGFECLYSQPQGRIWG
jgi:hypothetical protein